MFFFFVHSFSYAKSLNVNCRVRCLNTYLMYKFRTGCILRKAYGLGKGLVIYFNEMTEPGNNKLIKIYKSG